MLLTIDKSPINPACLRLFAVRLAVAAALIAAPAVPAFGQKKAQSKDTPPTAAGLPQPELIWPMPPDPPRIRWLAEFADMAKVKSTVVRKPGFMERITGSKTPDEKLELRKPYGVATDSRGRIYTADGEVKTVFVIDAKGHAVEQRNGNSHAPLGMPVGVALDGADRLFVSDAELHSVICFSPSGQPLAMFGTSSLGRPGGIAIDRKRQRLYVADAKEGRVAIFNLTNFKLIGFYGKPSSNGQREPGTFFGPTNVAVDRKGWIYVSDTLNCRIQIFDANGAFVRAIGTQGDRPGEFIRPKGIAVDSEGHIYVADAEFNNFQILTPEGQPLLAIGSLGTDRGQFVLLAGLYIDDQDRIYTTEMFHGRVQVFQYLSQPGVAAEKGVNGGND